MPLAINNIISISLLIIFIVVFRFIPHLPNATPLGYSVFNTAKTRGFSLAVAVIISTLLISDIFIGVYNFMLMAIVYGSFLIYALFGYLIKRKIISLSTSFLLVSASAFFFFATNIGVWTLSNWYPKTPFGLFLCLLAGVPFFGSMILGDIASFLIHRFVLYVIEHFKKIMSPVSLLLVNNKL